MTEVGTRELRNGTRQLLARVEAGEEITITIDGRPVAALVPLRRPRWMDRDEFVRTVLSHQTDAALTNDLRAMLPDTTDDTALR